MEITYASSSSRDISSLEDSSSSITMPYRAVKIIPLQHPSSSAPSSSSAASALFLKWKSKVNSMTWIDWIETLIPCTRWMRTYKWREYLQIDLMAGLTVGVMLVPQAMSYAKLAGLEPIYGLSHGLFSSSFYQGIETMEFDPDLS